MRQATKPTIIDNAVINGKTYKRLAVMDGKGGAMGITYNATRRWKRDPAPKFQMKRAKSGREYMLGTRPDEKGDGYHYKYFKVANPDRWCSELGEKIWTEYDSKNIHNANIQVRRFDNDPSIVYRRNRIAIQRMLAKKRKSTLNNEMPSTSGLGGSSGVEDMDASRSSVKRNAEGEQVSDQGFPLFEPPSPASSMSSFTTNVVPPISHADIPMAHDNIPSTASTLSPLDSDVGNLNKLDGIDLGILDAETPEQRQAYEARHANEPHIVIHGDEDVPSPATIEAYANLDKKFHDALDKFIVNPSWLTLARSYFKLTRSRSNRQFATDTHGQSYARCVSM